MIVFRSAVLVITGQTAVRKHAAALFRREKSILLQVCLMGRYLVFAFLPGKSLELAALVTSETSELANQLARKVLFTCVVYTKKISIYPIHTEIFAPKINEINFSPGRTVFVTSEKYRPTNHRPRTALCH